MANAESMNLSYKRAECSKRKITPAAVPKTKRRRARLEARIDSTLYHTSILFLVRISNSPNSTDLQILSNNWNIFIFYFENDLLILVYFISIIAMENLGDVEADQKS